MTGIPWLLVWSRGALAPVILAMAVAGASGTALVALVALALLSDALDGIIARRLGTATAALRRWDSIADAVFYFAAGGALLIRFPGALRPRAAGLLALVALELGRMLFERRKFGRIAAYHMWSARLWGVTLFLAFAEVALTGRAGPLLTLAIAAGLVTDAEGLAASVILPRWHHDVPSLVHALRLARAGPEESRP